MRDFPQGGLIGRIYALVIWLKERKIPMHAANAGYFIVMAIFPALLLILSSIRLTGLQVDALLGMLHNVLPAALEDTVEELVISTFQNNSATVAGIAGLTALWSSSRGIYGLMQGLNAIYGVEEDRSYFYTRSISVVYTFMLQVVLLTTLVLHVFGNSIIELLLRINNPIIIFIVDYLDLRFFFLLILQSLIFTLMFMVLPNRKNSFLESLPGGVFASLGWLIFSNLYSVYVEVFPRYAVIYGSVYALAIGLLWLYICLSILFYGGALNCLLMRKD